MSGTLKSAQEYRQRLDAATEQLSAQLERLVEAFELELTLHGHGIKTHKPLPPVFLGHLVLEDGGRQVSQSYIFRPNGYAHFSLKDLKMNDLRLTGLYPWPEAVIRILLTLYMFVKRLPEARYPKDKLLENELVVRGANLEALRNL